MRKITILTAVFALLAFLAIPMGMRGQTTETLNIANYADANNWENQTQYLTAEVGSVTFTATGGNNTGKYYTNGENWRFYQNESATITISVPEGNTLTSITPTFSVTNTGALLNGATQITNGNAVAVSGASVTFSVGNSGTATNGQVRFTEIVVTYTTGDTPPTPTTYTVTYDCNGGTSGCPENVTGIEAGTAITLAAAPTKTDYTFDGWNDGTTTHQAGASYTVNSNVTMTAQWTEIPSGDEQWVLTNLADLTASDVFVIVGNGYAMTNDNGTSSAPAPVAVTVSNNEITSNVSSNLKWTVSGDATNGYSFSPNGSTNTWLYCNTNASSSSNNNIRVGNGGQYNRIVFELTSDNYLVTKDEYAARYLSHYISNDVVQDWRGYLNTNSAVAISFYKKVTGGVLPPSISADNVSIEYNAESGSIAYTINNGVTGGTMSAVVSNGEWLTLGSGTASPISFTCTANEGATERTATVTLTYTYNRATATANVTVTQAGNPNTIDNISDITAAGTYSVQGTIVAKSTRGFIVGDGTGYVYYYNQNYTQADYNVGDMVKLDGPVVAYGGVFEFNSSTTITAATSSNYASEDPTVITGGEMDARVASNTPAQLSNYIQYEGTLSISGTYYNITDIVGATTAKGSISFPISTDFASLNGKHVKVTGYYVGVSSSTYYNTMLGSIEEVVNNNPSIAAEDVSIEYNATSGAIAFTINNPVSGGVLTAATESDWLTLGTVGTTVPFTCTANNEAAFRTATVTLTYTYNRATVTKNVIVTQAGNPGVTMTIAEVREQGTGNVVTIGTVTSFSVNNSNKTTAYIQDATAAIVVFGEFTVAVGDEIRVSGTLSTYHGLLEIGSNNNTPTIAVLSSGNIVAPIIKTIAEINADDYTSNNSIQGLYVTIENAKVTGISGSNTTIAQGDNTIVVRGISSDVTYAVNDILTLNGNIGCYDGAQIAHPTDVTVQSNQEPAITVTPTRVDVPCAAAEGTLTVTYQNIEMELGAEIYWYEADGETPATYDWLSATFDEHNNVTYTISANTGEARLAYLKVYGIGTDESDVYSSLITFSQGHYIPDFATLPFDFDGGRADIANTYGLTQNGLGTDYGSSPKLKFDHTGDWMILHFNAEPGQLIYSIKGNTFSGGTFTVQTSADGETYNNLAVYTELGATDTVEFDLGANVRYIKWIYTEKGNGNVALGNIHVTLPSTAPVITVTPALVELDADATDDVLEVTYQNITTIVAGVYFCNAQGQPAQYDWITADIDEDNNVYYVIDANEGTARTAYLKVYAPDDNDQVVYSNLVTISQAEYVIPMPEQQFALFGGDLVEGDYIIYYNGKAMNNVISSGRLQYAEIEPENDVITTDNAAIVWHIAPNDEGYWTIYSADANAYAASTGVKNKAQLLEDGTDDMAMWSVSEISDTYYEFVNKANEEDSINANLRNNGTYGFACYSATTGGALSLYKYTETVATYTLEIAGYGNSEGRYYLIASPVLAVTPTVDNGFLMEEPVQYDLYCFDQTFSGEEWRNYKVEPFNLTSGKGYLFASQGNTTLTFTGIPYNGDNDGAVALDYFGDDSSWNLIGNPYHSDAGLYVRFGNEYVYEEADYYVMNAEGTDFELADRVIHPKEGIFIQATAANEIACFCDGSWWPSNFLEGGEMLNVKVSDENGKGDIVRIRFGEGRTLNKFMLNENNTKLYFVLGDEELAVVRCGAESEMPLNFKPEANGTYTLSIDAEHVEMQYLHLIDNLTGEDIDLLANPSYKFEASVYDNAARFTLVVRK